MKKVSDFQQSSLKHIYQKSAQLAKLQHEINKYLPAELQGHCCVANFEKGILVFAVENAAWVMRLRYILSDLLSHLRKEAGLHQLSSIEYYIEPDFDMVCRTVRLKKGTS